LATQSARTSDAQGRAKLTLTVTPTSTGANWTATVEDGNASYGGYAASAGSWSVNIAGNSVLSASGKSYDFGSNVISSPYFPRSVGPTAITLSPGTYNASATFSGDGTTVGTANVSFQFTVASSAPAAFTNTPYMGGTVGTAYNNGLGDYVASTGATNISITSGSLPPGLSGAWESATSGFRVTGTPTTAGTYPFTLTATNTGGSTTYDASITITGSTQQTFSYSYDSAGGSITPSGATGVSSGTQITLGNPGTKSGYDFTGWYSSATGQTLGAGSSYTVNASTTFTAQWSSSGGGTTYYSYSYNSNGGSSTPSGSGSVASGTAITLGSPGTKTGYTFVGWYIDSGLNTYAGGVGNSYAITSSLTFYAKWSSSTSVQPEWPSPLPTLSRFIAGQPYTDSITASNMSAYNGVYSISSGSLPGGISINSATGELSGTVSTASDYSFTVTARNDNGSITQNYSGNIYGIMRVRQNEAWVKAIAKKHEGQIWKPGTVRVWSNGTWLYGS
jgi:large repetitive protein